MSATTTRVARDDHGLTLVELVVAFALLSIILAAAAGSLITFGRSAVDNERRVQATAVANRLHEELQALPWHDAVLYEDELDGLASAPSELAALLDLDAGTFEGREIVAVEGPGACPTPPAPCDARRDLVPYAVPPVMTLDGHDYEIFQVVTWDPVPDGIKHFTTVLRWQVMGQPVTQRFDSQRAATAGEAGDPLRPRVIQFDIGPSPMPLVAPDGEITLTDPRVDTASAPVNVVVRFSRGVQTASLSYWVIRSGHYYPASDPNAEPPVIAPVPPLTQVSVPMSSVVPDPDNGALSVGFEATLPAGHRFPNGPRTFKVTGTLGGETFGGASTATFWSGSPFPPVADPDSDSDVPVEPEIPGNPGDGGTAPTTPVAIATPIVSRAKVCLDANNRFFHHTIRVSAVVQGMTSEDHNVTVRYTAGGEQRVQSMQPLHGVESITPSGSTFVVDFAVGQDHNFRANNSTVFTVTALRATDGKAAGPVTSAQFSVTKPNNLTAPGQGCL